MKKILLVLLLIFLTANITSAGQVLTYEVSLDSDDMEEYVADGSMDAGSSDLELCLEKPDKADQKAQFVGIRFQNVNIPKGAVIENAYIQFTCDEANKNWDPFDVNIAGIAHANTDTFTTVAFNISSRSRTNTQVIWTGISHWTVEEEAGSNQQTPDLAAIVQEIVNQDGWIAGNAIPSYAVVAK